MRIRLYGGRGLQPRRTGNPHGTSTSTGSLAARTGRRVSGADAAHRPRTVAGHRRRRGSATGDLNPIEVWTKPGGAASVGFHVKHLAGALDRLLTYARGEALNAEQKAVAASEGDPGAPPATAVQLIEHLRAAIDRALAQVRATPVDDLPAVRGVGRAGLPTTVLGLLFHAAEHSTRHAGQIITTAKIVRSVRPAIRLSRKLLTAPAGGRDNQGSRPTLAGLGQRPRGRCVTQLDLDAVAVDSYLLARLPLRGLGGRRARAAVEERRPSCVRYARVVRGRRPSFRRRQLRDVSQRHQEEGRSQPRKLRDARVDAARPRPLGRSGPQAARRRDAARRRAAARPRATSRRSRRWVEREIETAELDAARDPGRVTMRRLNRTEYNNTVRDLLGVDIRPADEFPAGRFAATASTTSATCSRCRRC